MTFDEIKVQIIQKQQQIIVLANETIELVNQLDCNTPIPPPVEDFYIIDVSHHNRDVDWQKLVNDGVKAVYIRLSYGLNTDDMFATHYRNAKNYGLQTGAFHYLDTRYSSVSQANYFISQLALWTLDMPPALDVEEASFMPFPTYDNVKQFNDLLATVREHRVIYTSAYIYDRITTTDNFGCDLWVAHYGVTSPTIPKAWDDWHLWQFTSTGLDGNGHLDVNEFNGTYEQFLQWIGGTPPPPSDTFDIWSYMMPDVDNVTYEVKHQDGSQERIQNQYGDSNELYIVKGENQGYWEQWQTSNKYIYLLCDTSPSNEPVTNIPRYYKVNSNLGGGAWCERHMKVGETFNDGGHWVQFYAKSDCRELSENSGNATNNNTLIAHYPTMSFTAGEQPIILNDVIEIGNPNGERHWFAKNVGRVKWVSDWGSSEISELHTAGSRPVIQREVIGCM